jgi:hypothetical protein
MLKGSALAVRITKLGLQSRTYYEGVMLDIDSQFGAAADGNYHRVADQAHVDLAHALGATSVKLAGFH